MGRGVFWEKALEMLAIGNNAALADRLAIPSSAQAGDGLRPPRSAGGWESHSISVPKAPSGGTYSNHVYNSYAPMQQLYGGFGGLHHPSFGPTSPYGLRPVHGMWPGQQYTSQPMSPSMNPLYATPTGQSLHNQGNLYSTPTGTPILQRMVDQNC